MHGADVGLTDAIDRGTENSTITVGGHEMQRQVRILRCGKSVEFTSTVRPLEPVTLEIEELWGREKHTIACVVYIDGVKRGLRTYRGCGAGPVHYFVEAPPTVGNSVHVRIENISEHAVALGRVWTWSNLDEHVARSGMDVPFHIAPTVRLSFKNIDADVQKVRAIATALGDHPRVLPAWTTWIAYARWEPHETRERIDYVLDVARRAEMPVQICLDTWWAQTPAGQWRDQQYQQVVWNQSQRKFQLSIPNRWASTPWLTLNHPELNAFKTHRLRDAARHLGMRCRDQATRRLVLSVNLDNEPVYWASGNAGLGMELLWADFNPVVVEDAKRDGVILDPTDGLSFDERHWLWRNLLRYNEMIASAARQGLRKGQAGALDPDPLWENIYTQAMVANPDNQFPMMDRAYPLWESAAPRSARAGGEWNSDALVEREAIEHMLPLGRNAATNAECENNPDKIHGVKLAYALGQRYYTMYNYPTAHLGRAASELDDVDEMFPPHEYRPILLQHDFRDETWKTHVVSFEHVRTGQIGNTPAVAVYPESPEQPGVLTWRVRSPSGEFDGLGIEFLGRAKDYANQNRNVRIRVLAGLDDRMIEQGVLADESDINRLHRVDLSEAAKGKEELWVRVELHADGIPADVLSWCAIYDVSFTTSWPVAVTRGLDQHHPTLAESRRRSLLVSWRRDAEIVIDELPDEHPARELALAAYENGQYARAYRIAVSAIE